MRTGDILSLPNHPPADAFEWRSGVIGAILAAVLIVMALASAYSARPAQAVVPNTDESELSAFAKTLERSGTLYGLEILF